VGPVEIRSSFPILYVDDVPAAVRFYRDLGERVAYLEDPDGNPVHIRGPVAGGP
jgi:catechol 2,3-dioxygenase-like lactoylglutathione lyase family enzyme